MLVIPKIVRRDSFMVLIKMEDIILLMSRPLNTLIQKTQRMVVLITEDMNQKIRLCISKQIQVKQRNIFLVQVFGLLLPNCMI